MKEKIKEVLDVTNIKASNEIMILEYIDNLQQRIDKAIEYIERALKDDYSEFMYMSEPDIILDILRGEDNE